jgi:glucose-6-phosphate isomerase
MLYRQSIEGCLSGEIGAAGLSSDNEAHWLELAGPRFTILCEDAAAGSLAQFRTLNETGDPDEVRAASQTLSEGADAIVMLGTGGSSLGGQAVAQLAGWSIPGGLTPGPRGPKRYLYDNLDARSFMQGLRSFNIPKTRFIAISKSGTTAETLAQVLTVLKFIDDAGFTSLVPNLFLGITEPARKDAANGLRQPAFELGKKLTRRYLGG